MMSGILKKYENKDGYRIRATEKAYELYYKSQGFHPCSESEGHSTGRTAQGDNATDSTHEDNATDSTHEAGFNNMKVAALKAYLKEKGIKYDSKAGKEELVKLAGQATDRGQGIKEADPEDASTMKQE